jgi:hypothetical protein
MKEQSQEKEQIKESIESIEQSKKHERINSQTQK